MINSVKKCLENGLTPSAVKINSLTFTQQLLKHKTAEFVQMLKDMDLKTALVDCDKIRDCDKTKEILELLAID